MAYDFSKLNVLIIEDNQPLAYITRDILETFGIKNIEIRYNGADGYNSFCAGKFDILFIDWAMKPMNGLELLRKIRTDKTSPDQYIPIIMVTAYNDKAHVEQARDMGATEYLIKPFKAQDIYKRLVQIIERPRQFVKSPNFFGPDRRRRISDTFNGVDRRKNKQDTE